MTYTIEQITTLTGAHRYGSSSVQVEWLLTDSRSLSFPESSLFFALRTSSGDGHRYIADLYRRGVRAFVVETLPEAWQTDFPEANFLLVPSPLKALQRLAERHRDAFSIPVVGLTGSNGKTTVKEWLYQLLSPERVVCRSPRSYNSQIGVPLSVWQLSERTELALFEAGVSRRGEMAALRAIIQPTLGVFTCLGPAHQEYFGSMAEKCMEKLQLFKDCPALVIPIDDPIVADCLQEADFSGELITWSRRDASARLFVETAPGEQGTTLLTCHWAHNIYNIQLPFINEASIQNAITCIAVCLHLGMDSAVLAERIQGLEHIAMRLEVKQGEHGLTLINDSYNSDLASLDIALDFMARRPELAGRRRTLVLSDILQTGLSSQQLYTQVAQMVAHRGVDFLVGVGPEISQWQHLIGVAGVYFKSSDELLRSGLLSRLHDEVVLFKGARRFGFERLLESLALQVHETTLEVNLAALAKNVNYYRSFMRPDTKMVCMVKADAYGAGAVEVSRALQDKGVDYLAVAVADEGAALRRAGITTGILIMNPELTAFPTLFRYNLEPEVYNFKMLEALIHAAERAGIQNFPIHVKLDTGMCRLGFNPQADSDDISRLIARLQRQDALVVRSVFSHFVGSDSPDFDEFSARQFALFDAASRRIQEAFPHRILRHICNSAGIERFPERHLDMVRLGLGLYGVSPLTGGPLNTVSSLKTTILQIREVPAGTSIGYSRRTIVDRPSRIAAIPIGYADGLDRHLGNRRGHCLVGGRPAPYLGNICMDVCMIDVTDIPCREGDAVEIFGEELPVSTLSDTLDTIPYEILTSVSGRVKRVYFR
ncbi:MAG: bifunctional UDP-N-acetylmuramoyl-tripeptide:D-alanyl-D-alanine ligase/alanine racemase [Bacteroidaceae bacterium]|nr:bifunctional UDP-N-acetylmuramoyl-tripeptide:D-alanyl-D-alanine ligase/alanine racemase [Bacteroidaceae bacterium]